jgi:hypothetical protein
MLTGQGKTSAPRLGFMMRCREREFILVNRVTWVPATDDWGLRTRDCGLRTMDQGLPTRL